MNNTVYQSADFDSRSPFSRMSVPLSIIIAFVIVASILLLGFGIIDFKLEKNRQLNNLHKELERTVEELKSNLSLPVWNYNNDQIDSIIESAMSNQNIYGIVVTISENIYLRARGDDWQIITPDTTFSSDGLLAYKRDILFSGQQIGAIELFGSTRLMEENLRMTFLSVMSFITIFVFVIIVGLYLVLHAMVLKPVMNIEQYAGTVRSNKGKKGLRIKGRYFQGELDALRRSLEKMVEAHEARFIELQNEMKLRAESDEKYRNIFENSLEGIFQSTPEGKMLDINPAMARIFGYDSTEQMAEEVFCIDLYVNPDDRTYFTESLSHHEKVECFEVQMYRKDRKKIWVSISAREVCDHDGNLRYYEGTVIDITARKEVEADKERLKEQLLQAQKIEAIGTLAGGIAHDFNNILMIISGCGSMLQMELGEDGRQKKYINQILEASEKAMNLTRSLLAFSRKQPVQLQAVDLNHIVAGVERLLKRLLTEDIVLQTKLSDEKLVIMGDVTQIDQILFNLATNARDAMLTGGQLTIETGRMELKEGATDMLGYIKAGTYARLSVSDTGMGIDEETVDQIFDPFYTTKEVGKGTGLGLSTVFGAVKQHNGYISVDSPPGTGATFHMYFPIAPEPMQYEMAEQGQIAGGKETILVAEDNEDVRDLVKIMLARSGYKIIEAKDGIEAVNLYRTNPAVDLIILDSVMPRKNGREVYDEIRRENPNIKVLFTSGYTRDIILDKGIEENEVAFIPKPITQKALLEKVREVLDQHPQETHETRDR